MGRPSKGGRKKNLWDISATIRALDRVLGDEDDPGNKNLERSFLHFVRALCRSLNANMPAIAAFDRLFRLMRDKAGPIRRYARDVHETFTASRPLAPGLNELLKRGEADELWNLWFFACEMPKRLQAAMANVDRLLYAGEALMPAPLSLPGFQVATTRAVVLLGLRAHEYDADRIASLLDPAGHKQDAAAARDRIRKEIGRLDLMISQSKSDSEEAKAQISNLLAAGSHTGDRSD